MHHVGELVDAARHVKWGGTLKTLLDTAQADYGATDAGAQGRGQKLTRFSGLPALREIPVPGVCDRLQLAAIEREIGPGRDRGHGLRR
ncbi:hypothetical protein DP43_3637 [Burkholderia pseudomallei]|nr:hypothetical protein DP43_3637 [Burkholderia pseudomallei]